MTSEEGVTLPFVSDVGEKMNITWALGCNFVYGVLWILTERNKIFDEKMCEEKKNFYGVLNFVGTALFFLFSLHQEAYTN